MTSAIQLSRDIIRHHSKSFSLARRLLPSASRDAAAVVYAWCRRADDAVDELPRDEAVDALERLERELDSVYAGEPQGDPLVQAFSDVVHRYGIPQQYPAELLAGMRMDVEGVIYGTLLDLQLYCYRVAGTVGLMMCHVMGIESPRALKHAAHLGIAMQLTNICRDVVEDWNRGRLYLPLTFLSGRPPACGVHGRFPDEMKRPVARAVERLLRVADHFYLSGERGCDHLSLANVWAVLVARLIYARIGGVIRRRGCDVTLGRAYVPWHTKFALALYGLALVLIAVPARLLERHHSRRPLVVLRYPADVLPL